MQLEGVQEIGKREKVQEQEKILKTKRSCGNNRPDDSMNVFPWCYVTFAPPPATGLAKIPRLTYIITP